jgi:outer membrane protein OmpA-like peptidoglycan-associated protein
MLFRKRNNDENETDWLPISDLMSGLMAIFILIALSYAYIIAITTINPEEIKELKKEIADLQIQNQDLKNQIAHLMEIKERIRKLASSVDDAEKVLYDLLFNEFKNDLKRWDAEILKNSTFRFKSPDILFERGKSDLQYQFKAILMEFFPRYINVLKKFDQLNGGNISEIRVEGHTSPEWYVNSAGGGKDNFIKNSELSQARAYQVLSFSLNLPSVYNNFEWLKTRLRANGLSSSQLIYYEDSNKIDYDASRRVEFRAVVESRTSLKQISDEIKKIDELLK